MFGLNKLAYVITTGFGSGYFPVIPGTIGSIVAAIIYWFFLTGNMNILLIAFVFFILGTVLSDTVEKNEGKDPGMIVIDEFVGQWLTYLFLPKSIVILIAGFFLFRILDIIKPYPANAVQNIDGGLGIMLDDVIAAIYANLILQAVNLWIL